MSIQNHLKLAEFLATLFDGQYSILGVRFGLDAVLGLLPGLGDLLAMTPSMYMIFLARKLNVPDEKVAQMVGNMILDFLIGSVPFLGDIGDVFFRVNLRNLAILKQYARSNVIEGEIIAARQ